MASADDSTSNPEPRGDAVECPICPRQVDRCAHWGPFVVRLYPPSRFDPRLTQWGVEGPGIIDEGRSRREGLPAHSMYLPSDTGYSGRHADHGHAVLDFETRAASMRRYDVPDEGAPTS